MFWKFALSWAVLNSSPQNPRPEGVTLGIQKPSSAPLQLCDLQQVTIVSPLPQLSTRLKYKGVWEVTETIVINTWLLSSRSSSGFYPWLDSLFMWSVSLSYAILNILEVLVKISVLPGGQEICSAVTALTVKPNKWSLVPRAHTMVEENLLLRVVNDQYIRAVA